MHPIAAFLGRSDHRSIDNLKKHLKDVKAGKANPLERVSCLQGNVTSMILERIEAKLDKDYGPNTALVVRDASPMDWPWDEVKEQIKAALDLSRNPYDKGIWVLSFSKDRIYQIL